MLGSGAGAVCATCHEGADDAGARGADQMRRALERLKTAADGAQIVIARVGNAGIEVGEQELALAEARTHLTRARTELHAFEPATVDTAIDAGLALVASVDRAGEAAVAELAYRRRGLAWSLGAILVFVVALGLKIRQLEAGTRDQGLGTRD
jgi:hypothetical protein